MSYTKDYFEDRKFKYEKNHGKFIHEFMFAEHEGRILGQCNVALNDLQKQLDQEVARAKAEEARLDKKIDAETTRAKAEEARLDGKIDAETTRATGEEARLDGKIDAETTRAKAKEEELTQNFSSYLPLRGGDMSPDGVIVWAKDGDNPQADPYLLGGVRWIGASDEVSIKGKITGEDNMNLIINLGDDNSNAIVITDKDNTEVASIHSDGEYTGTIDWSRVKNRPEMDKQALDNLNLNLTTLREAYKKLEARLDKLDGGPTE